MYRPSPSRLTPAAPSERGQLFLRGENQSSIQRRKNSQRKIITQRMYAILPTKAQAAQPTQTRTGGKAAAAAPGRISAPAQDDGHAPSPNPMAQPTQKRTGGKAAAAAPGRTNVPTQD